MTKQDRAPIWVFALLLLIPAGFLAYGTKILSGPHFALAVAWFFVPFLSLLLLFQRETTWKSKTVLVAFFVNFVFEMYGFAYSLFVLWPLIGADWWPKPGRTRPGLAFPYNALLDGSYSPLLDRSVRIHVLVVCAVVGMMFIGLGWRRVWAARGSLATSGIYRWMRHPQYLGFIVVMAGVTYFYPTPPQLAGFVLLLVMYIRLAHREDVQMRTRFPEEFAAYAARAGMFWPRFGK